MASPTGRRTARSSTCRRLLSPGRVVHRRLHTRAHRLSVPSVSLFDSSDWAGLMPRCVAAASTSDTHVRFVDGEGEVFTIRSRATRRPDAAVASCDVFACSLVPICAQEGLERCDTRDVATATRTRSAGPEDWIGSGRLRRDAGDRAGDPRGGESAIHRVLVGTSPRRDAPAATVGDSRAAEGHGRGPVRGGRSRGFDCDTRRDSPMDASHEPARTHPRACRCTAGVSEWLEGRARERRWCVLGKRFKNRDRSVS